MATLTLTASRPQSHQRLVRPPSEDARLLMQAACRLLDYADQLRTGGAFPAAAVAEADARRFWNEARRARREPPNTHRDRTRVLAIRAARAVCGGG